MTCTSLGLVIAIVLRPGVPSCFYTVFLLLPPLIFPTQRRWRLPQAAQAMLAAACIVTIGTYGMLKTVTSQDFSRDSRWYLKRVVSSVSGKEHMEGMDEIWAWARMLAGWRVALPESLILMGLAFDICFPRRIYRRLFFILIKFLGINIRDLQIFAWVSVASALTVLMALPSPLVLPLWLPCIDAIRELTKRSRQYEPKSSGWGMALMGVGWYNFFHVLTLQVFACIPPRISTLPIILYLTGTPAPPSLLLILEAQTFLIFIYTLSKPKPPLPLAFSLPEEIEEERPLTRSNSISQGYGGTGSDATTYLLENVEAEEKEGVRDFREDESEPYVEKNPMRYLVAASAVLLLGVTLPSLIGLILTGSAAALALVASRDPKQSSRGLEPEVPNPTPAYRAISRPGSNGILSRMGDCRSLANGIREGLTDGFQSSREEFWEMGEVHQAMLGIAMSTLGLRSLAMALSLLPTLAGSPVVDPDTFFGAIQQSMGIIAGFLPDRRMGVIQVALFLLAISPPRALTRISLKNKIFREITARGVHVFVILLVIFWSGSRLGMIWPALILLLTLTRVVTPLPAAPPFLRTAAAAFFAFFLSQYLWILIECGLGVVAPRVIRLFGINSLLSVPVGSQPVDFANACLEIGCAVGLCVACRVQYEEMSTIIPMQFLPIPVYYTDKIGWLLILAVKLTIQPEPLEALGCALLLLYIPVLLSIKHDKSQSKSEKLEKRDSFGTFWGGLTAAVWATRIVARHIIGFQTTQLPNQPPPPSFALISIHPAPPPPP
ncbi:hypothetical protein AAMO2058_000842500 [Amorphochlora amoebiformis]